MKIEKPFVDPEIEFKFYCEIKFALAIAYDFLEKTNKALAQLEDLIDRPEELEDDFIGSMYMEMAQIYTSRKEYDKAFEYAVKAEKIIPLDSTIKLLINNIKNLQESAINTEDESIELPNTSQHSPKNIELDKTDPVSINHLIEKNI